jgi:PAS domain S-box-containing protein
MTCPPQNPRPRVRPRQVLGWILIGIGVLFILVQSHEIKLSQEREKLIESEREKAQLRAELIITSSPYALIMCNEQGQIRISNMAAEHLLGWPHEELIGQQASVIIPPGYREAHLKGMQRSAAHIRQYAGSWMIPQRRLKLQALHRNQTLVDVEATLRVIKYKDTVEFILAMKPLDGEALPSEPVPLPPLPLDDVESRALGKAR